MSKTYRHIPHWAPREPHTRREFLLALGTDGAQYSGSTHMASSRCPNGYDKYEIIGAASSAFNKRRASHINRRRGKALTAKLLQEAIVDIQLDQEYLQEITESDLDIDWTDELDEWLDEHDYSPNLGGCDCSPEDYSSCANRNCPNSTNWPEEEWDY